MRTFRSRGEKFQKEWQIWVEGAEVHTKWGKVDSEKMQHTFEVAPGAFIGKSNEMSQFVHARAIAERKIEGKLRRNYFEVDSIGAPLEEQEADEVDCDNPKRSIRAGKPTMQPRRGKKADASQYDKMVAARSSESGIITRKMNGFFHYFFVGSKGKVQVFTRRFEDHTEKYPTLVKSLERAKFPKNTVLFTELVVKRRVKGHVIEDRIAMQSISNSLPKRARALQLMPQNQVTAVVLLIPYWKDEFLSERTFGQLLEMVEENFGLKRRCPVGFEGIEILYMDFAESKKWVKTSKAEGVVIYDGNSVPGEKLINFQGRPKRYTSMCWKWKPIKEDDFLVVFDPESEDWERGGGYGKGRIAKLPGKVALYQMNDEGKWVYICLCGTGFDDEQRREVLKYSEERSHMHMCGVAEISYAERRYMSQGDKTNALTDPGFSRWRGDKPVDEVVNPLL